MLFTRRLSFTSNSKLAGEERPELDQLLEMYQHSWKDRAETEVRFGKTESVETLNDLASRMLDAFLESDLSQPEGRIIGR